MIFRLLMVIALLLFPTFGAAQPGDSQQTFPFESVTACRAALEALTRDDAPADWAKAQGQLGAALLALGEEGGEEGGKCLEDAVVACREALKVFTYERSPLDWAKAQGQLGGAILALGRRRPKDADSTRPEDADSTRPEDADSTRPEDADSTRPKDAVAACRAALEVLTPENAPADWVKAQGHLGDGLVALRWSQETGQPKWKNDMERLKDDTERLKDAANAYRKALEVRTRERFPLDWAGTQHRLGEAHLQLGRRTQDDSHYGEAAYAFQLATEMPAYKEHAPADWARTRHRLGEALLSWGGNEARLKGAVTAFREALEVLTRKRLPLDRARTQGHLGGALVALGKLQGDAERLEEAVVTCHAALEVLTCESSDPHWAATHVHFANALLALCDLQGDDAGRLKEAVAAFGAALEGGHRKGKHWDGVRKRDKHARARLARLG